jgi:nicotinamidase-related amidase
MVHKGVHSFIESYSSFYDNCKVTETELRQELVRRDVGDIYVCGLAYDVCVGED